MELNDKYQKAIAEQRDLFQMVYAGNRALESKASAIIQASGLITGLVTAAKVASGAFSDTLSLALMIIVLVLFVFMVGLALRVWLPRTKTLPNQVEDWDKLFTNHIYAEDEADLKQTLYNYVDSIRFALGENEQQSTYVRVAGLCLGGQAIVLIALLALS